MKTSPATLLLPAVEAGAEEAASASAALPLAAGAGRVLVDGGGAEIKITRFLAAGTPLRHKIRTVPLTMVTAPVPSTRRLPAHVPASGSRPAEGARRKSAAAETNEVDSVDK
jgi:hypothetical protein